MLEAPITALNEHLRFVRTFLQEKDTALRKQLGIRLGAEEAIKAINAEIMKYTKERVDTESVIKILRGSQTIVEHSGGDRDDNL